MDKRYRTVKTLVALFCALLLATLLSLVIYAYRTPRVYATFATKELLNGKLCDCVIPAAALHDGNTVYVVVARDTAIGKRYRVSARTVFVEAEENGRVAVDLATTGKVMVVLAHDGRLKENDEVLAYVS